MAENEGGILLYLDQEGRGNGIANKIRAYKLQSQGYDTYDADEVLGFEADQRRFDFAAAMLNELGIGTVRLMTNNPEKIARARQGRSRGDLRPSRSRPPDPGECQLSRGQARPRRPLYRFRSGMLASCPARIESRPRPGPEMLPLAACFPDEGVTEYGNCGPFRLCNSNRSGMVCRRPGFALRCGERLRLIAPAHADRDRGITCGVKSIIRFGSAVLSTLAAAIPVVLLLGLIAIRQGQGAYRGRCSPWRRRSLSPSSCSPCRRARAPRAALFGVGDGHVSRSAGSS